MTSREIEDTIGIIIIARTIPAVNTSRPNGACPKKGMYPPKVLYKGFSIKSKIQNLNTNNAQKPKIMLGTAANNSITKDNGVLILGEDSSERNIAIPKLIGTPIAMAIAEVTKVPTMYGSAPKDSRPSTGFQFVPVKKLIPSNENIFTEPLPTA
jgi:hypothetical protein